MKFIILLLGALALSCSASPLTSEEKEEVSPMQDPSFTAPPFPETTDKETEPEFEDETDKVDPPADKDLQSKIRYPSGYQEGWTYVYHYEAQILTGVPQTASHYTGYKLRASVLLAMHKDRKVHMKMGWVNLRRTDRILPVDLPVVQVSPSLFSELSNQKVKSEITWKLRLPIVFTWLINGTVDDIIHHREDLDWSINIKKAIISMLNVDMKVKVRDIFQSNGIWKESEQFEDGIEGKCQSNYVYNRFPYTVKAAHHNNRNLITVVKSRDLLNCSVVPWMVHSLFINRECNETRRPVSAQSETRYNATKSGINFFLRQIWVISQNIYNPEDREAGSVGAFTVQNLRFVSERERIDIKLRQSEGRKDRRGLMMILPIQEMRIVKPDSARLRAWASSTLNMLERDYKRDNMNMHQRMRLFIETTRKMSAADIKAVILPKLKPNSKSKIRQMILELLPKIATVQVAEVIIDSILETDLSDDEKAMLVSRLNGMSFVTHDIMVRRLMKTANKLKSKEHKQTYKSLLLSIGQLINTCYTHPVPGHKKKLHPLLTRQSIRKFYEKILKKHNPILPRKEKQMIVALSLGNCRLVDPCLDILETMIPPKKSIVTSVRIKALFALGMMASEAPLRVRKLVMPIYSDWRENAELRLASYLVFIRSWPTRSDLRMITESLIKEPSKQVRSFVQSHLEALSGMSWDRCESGLAWNASRVLDDLLSPEQFGAQYSQVHLRSIKAIKQMLAGWIANNRGFLPKMAGVQLIIQAMGLDIEMMDIGIDLNDLQQMLDRLLGPDGTWRLLTENDSIKDLLRSLSEKTNKAMDVDLTKVLMLYEGFYDLNGLSTEATHLLKQGLIPLSKSLYDLVTKGGQREITMNHTLFVDRVSQIPTSFGVPFSVNHTITGHVEIDANVTLKPNLFATIFGAELNIKHRASFHKNMRVGVCWGALSSFVEAFIDGQMPRSRINTIKVAVENQKERKRIRVNINRPIDDTEVLWLRSVIRGVQKVTRPWRSYWWTQPIRHRSLPPAQRNQTQLVSLPSIGLGLKVEKLHLNTTGIADFPKLPFYGPAELKVIIERDTEVGGYRSIDIYGVYRKVMSSIRDIVDKAFESKNDDENMRFSQSEQEQLVSNVGRVERRLIGAQLRLANLTIESMTHFGDSEDLPPPIVTAEVQWATHSWLRGLWLAATAQKLSSEPWKWELYFLRHVSKEVQLSKFDKEDPLKILKDALAHNHLVLKHNHRLVLRSLAVQTIGEWWRSVIERIKGNEKKVLMNMQDLQACQEKMKRHPDSPACLQAWRDINAYSQVQLFVNVYRNAPHLLKMLPLAVHDAMRVLLREAHVSSNLTKLDTPLIHKLRLDLQLSPYNSGVFTAWNSAVDIIDRYVNARSWVYLRNSLTQRPKQNLWANIFDKLYPATCQIVSNPKGIQVRTFDGLDYEERNPLRGNVGGRIVLVQDIKDRLQVSEQRAKGHRVTFIRLKEIADRVLVVTDESKWPEVPPPKIMYKSRWQTLPFELKNSTGNVVLRAVREPTARSLSSISVHLPALGSVVRTHPLISTDIVLDPFFHSTIRGVCGDFDGALVDELKAPLCHVVYQNPADFVKRYTTTPPNMPWLRRLEHMPSMIRWMPTKQCPRRRRHYPTIL